MENNLYLEDILSQQEELLHAVEAYGSLEQQKILMQIGMQTADKVIFSGMGSSHFCALGAAIRLQQHGISSQVISTGELIYYQKECLDENTVLCLISQSGESAETRHLLEQLGEDIYVVGITNQPESTLAKRSNACLLLNVSDEVSVTTRTYLSSLVAAQLVAAALCGDSISEILEEYRNIAQDIGTYLTGYEEKMAHLADFFRGMQYVCLIGRGDSLSSVRAGSLFFREVLKFPALDFDSAEFRHGPMEMVQEDFYGIVFAPSGRTQHLSVQMALDIAEKGGHVLLITDGEGYTKPICRMEKKGNILVQELPVVSEFAAPILQILPIQLLADVLTVEKGIPAGVFRWGSKIMSIE